MLYCLSVMKIKISARNLLGLFIAVLSSVLLVIVLVNYRERAPEELIEALPQNVDIVVKGIDYTETRDGLRRWHLLADSADYSVKDGFTLIRDVFMTFFDEQGEQIATLKSQTGELHTESKEVTARGEVVVESVRGYFFYSDYLDFSEAARLITTDAPIRMLSDEMELTGTGLKFDVDKHAYQVLGQVKARIQKVAKP
ncbi:LPS export ABC transporter periplasmic protein LptC [Trichloromonas acetexigens]|uniref:LPS export ABC transporter periplasmic protein LptC n=1 Tax=Trichloromonas acetexigens TaxID=38815 RepID=A0A550JLJ8_9BACT|nr:LPS export ABC transporter periplasmic protein LptC [Desulfuromonas acetexigens]